MSEWDIELSYMINLRVSTRADDEVSAIKEAKSIIEEKTKGFPKIDSIGQGKLEFNGVVYANKKVEMPVLLTK